jgi:hypothetical protein
LSTKIKSLTLKVNGKFEISRMNHISYDIIQNERVEPQETQRNFADAKYQYQYNFGGHTYKQVFEIAGLKVPTNSGSPGDEISTLYLRIKLEYLRRRNWQPAGEQRSISFSNFGGIATYPGTPSKVFGNLNLPYITQNRDYVYEIHRVRGAYLNANSWTYNLSSNYMHTFVPSHNQCASGPCSGGHGLAAAAFWIKSL